MSPSLSSGFSILITRIYIMEAQKAVKVHYKSYIIDKHKLKARYLKYNKPNK